jgi:protein kinase A
MQAQVLRLDDYLLLETVGVGNLGRVRLAQERSTGALYALKFMKKAKVIAKRQVDHVMSEIAILAMITHPFTVNMLGIAQDSCYVAVVMEYVPGGELFKYLRAAGRLGVSQAQFYSAQIVLIFEYLHSKNIVYRDLKPENIVIGSDGYLKLADFGFAKVVLGRTYTICGTPEYIAPEVILNKGHSLPVDWWALGVLIYELLVGIDPFSNDDPVVIFRNIIDNNIRYPKAFDIHARGLIKHLLEADLGKRYGNLRGGAGDIKRHKFFKGIDWRLLINRLVPAPYKPILMCPRDTSNFASYPDSTSVPTAVDRDNDPFINF